MQLIQSSITARFLFWGIWAAELVALILVMKLFIHVARIYANVSEQRKCLLKKRVQLPQDWLRLKHNMIAVTSGENALDMKIVYENCGVKDYIKEDHRSYRRNFCSCGKRA